MSKKGTDSILAVTLTNLDNFFKIIFGMSHSDNPCDWKIVKCRIIEKCRFCKKRNARIHSASTVSSKFAGFKSSRLTYVGNRPTARQGVQNIHDWPRRTRAPLSSYAVLEFVEIKAGSRRHCSFCISSSLVVSQGVSRPAAVTSSAVFDLDIVFSAIYDLFAVVYQSNSLTHLLECLTGHGA